MSSMSIAQKIAASIIEDLSDLRVDFYFTTLALNLPKT